MDRGVSVSAHLKAGLVSIACAVDKMNIPRINCVSIAQEKQNTQQRLNDYGFQLPDPYSLDLKNDFTNSPPFGLFDIFNHLVYHPSQYDRQGLAACKSYEDYRLYVDGYVESLVTKYEEKVGVRVYVGQVKLAMKKTKNGNSFYKLWFLIEGRGARRGSILDAYCECLGGKGGGCKHISAALYSLEALLNSREEESVTSGPCLWTRKPKPDTTACDMKDLKVSKKDDTATVNKRAYTFSEYIDHDPRYGDHRRRCAPEALRNVVLAMKRMESKPAILDILQNQLAAEEDTLTKSVSEEAGKPPPVCTTSQLGIMQEKVLEYLGSTEEVNAELFANQLNFTDKEMTTIKSVTKAQSGCEEWFCHKTGFISASKAKSVCTR